MDPQRAAALGINACFVASSGTRASTGANAHAVLSPKRRASARRGRTVSVASVRGRRSKQPAHKDKNPDTILGDVVSSKRRDALELHRIL